ncbi:MAG TPA: DUF5989 family protein [Patescibacteria group bacterium]
MQFIKKIFHRIGIITELLGFFWENKLWWGIPFVIVLLVISFFIFFGQSAPIVPFVYSLF